MREREKEREDRVRRESTHMFTSPSNIPGKNIFLGVFLCHEILNISHASIRKERTSELCANGRRKKER